MYINTENNEIWLWFCFLKIIIYFDAANDNELNFFFLRHLKDVVIIGLTKKFLWVLSKNKRCIFHFPQELYWTMSLSFCYTTFCHFQVTS